MTATTKTAPGCNHGSREPEDHLGSDPPNGVHTEAQRCRPAGHPWFTELAHADVVVETVDLADVADEPVAVCRQVQSPGTVVLRGLQPGVPQRLRYGHQAQHRRRRTDDPAHGRPTLVRFPLGSCARVELVELFGHRFHPPVIRP